MTVSLAPLASRIRQRLPGARPLETFATESIVIQQAEDQALPPAVYPEGELERITGVHEFSAGIEDELRLTTCTTVHHTETIAWRLRDVCISRSRLCNMHSYRMLTFGRSASAPAQLTDITDTVAFCSTAAGNDYFAHLLLDDAATALLGREFGKVLFGGNVGPRTPHMRDYLRFFGVGHAEVTAACLRDVWLFTDHAQNSHRRDRIATLRTRIRALHAGAAAPPVYLRRGRSGAARTLENENELETALESRGFRIVDPEALDAADICRLLGGTPLVVGVEGSQLVHGLLNLRDGGALLCIQPAARFNAVYRGFCNSLGLHWGFAVAEGSADQFALPADRLMRTIDLLAARSDLPC